MTNYYTENMADFGYREIRLLRDTLSAWLDNGLPGQFSKDGVKPAMNSSSGYVFLVNEDYQVAMLNGKQLEEFYTLPYGGIEGFLDDIVAEHDPDSLHADDVAFVLNAADITGFDLQPPWLDAKIDRILQPE